MTVSFCSTCGTAICKEGDADNLRGIKIVFAGTLDDADGLLTEAPQSELWTKYKLDWVGGVRGDMVKRFEEFN